MVTNHLADLPVQQLLDCSLPAPAFLWQPVITATFPKGVAGGRKDGGMVMEAGSLGRAVMGGWLGEGQLHRGHA